ncbi:hypothetical protein [Dysgonomonas sp. ZJ709]|nr:hypothetical protein [Dysgonomonas sp. ZJ709]
MKKLKISRKTVERAVYILIIIGLVVYGLKDAEVAVKLIKSVIEAFSIIL